MSHQPVTSKLMLSESDIGIASVDARITPAHKGGRRRMPSGLSFGLELVRLRQARQS